MGKAICCDVCGTFEKIKDEYSANKVIIRDETKESDKYAEYELCTTCLSRVYTLFRDIGNCSQGKGFTG